MDTFWPASLLYRVGSAWEFISLLHPIPIAPCEKNPEPQKHNGYRDYRFLAPWNVFTAPGTSCLLYNWHDSTVLVPTPVEGFFVCVVFCFVLFCLAWEHLQSSHRNPQLKILLLCLLKLCRLLGTHLCAWQMFEWNLDIFIPCSEEPFLV